MVGTGAGGSVAGALLAEGGHDVVFLEEGGYYPTESFISNISEMTTRLYRNSGIFPFLGNPPIAFAEGCCVGGSTIINGALVCPTPEWILNEWQEDYGLKGYGQQDLQKYFEIIERDLHVVRHELEIDKNLDSFKLFEASKQLGWKCELTPRAIKNCKNSNLCPTGCPTGAKQSTLETYLPRAMKKGGRIFSRCRAIKILYSNGKAQKIIARVVGKNSKSIEISFKYLFIAGGAIQTPHLLHRSGISRLAGRNLQFHITLKSLACFRERLNAEVGTMFTTQVQEFEKEGMLIMTSNLRPHYVAMTLSHFGNEVINSVLKEYQYSAIFATMIRPQSVLRIISCFDHPIVVYRFNIKDLFIIKQAIQRTATLLFQCGATRIFLPIRGIGAISSIKDVEKILEKIKPRDVVMLCLHIMASCPMGINSSRSVVDLDGRVWGMKNVFLTDASVLPSNTGRNPQGTIMAFAHEIINRHLMG
ncbi:MAG: GMC family oxidoreductase [Candidatus Nitrosotenuis sp.]